MGAGSILALVFLMGLTVTAAAFGLSQQDPNEILRNSINTAAGMELIPKDTQFELKKFTGVTTSKCTDFGGGGKGCVYNMVATSKEDNSGASTREAYNLIPSLTPFVFLFCLNHLHL